MKNGKEAILVTLITGTYGALTVLLKDQHPLVGLAVFAATTAITYIIVWKGMSKIKNAVHDPEAHPVFNTIDTGVKLAFNYLPIAHAKKKKLVILYIKTKYMLIKDALLRTIKDGNIKELPIRVVSAVAETSEKLKDVAPCMFLEKMEAWDNKHNSWAMDALNTIIDSSFYSDTNMKYSACFDCVQVMIKSTFVAAENTINELNGELEAFLDRSDINV